MTFNSAAHPRAASGQPIGGQFVAGKSSSSQAKAAKANMAVRKLTLSPVPPNGLGYTDAQWRQLRQWEADFKAGKKLDAHQLHMLHQAHLRRLKTRTPIVPKRVRRHHRRHRTVKMSSSVYTPFRTGTTVELSAGRWRKQLLPLGSITYKGRKIEFSRDYLASIVDAFRDKAVNRVPFQLAGPDNKHTNAVLSRGGTVVGVELMPDGLDIVLESPDPDVAKMLHDYPDTGVSARIYENYTREHDGRHWPAALQHVLATNDEHITGLRPWKQLEPVSLSSDGDAEIIDLTGSTFREGKEEEVPRTKKSLKETLAKLRDGGDEANLDDDELDQLLAILNEVNDDPEEDDEELTDDELNSLIAAAEADDPASSGVTEPVTAANTNGMSVELAQQLAQQALEMAVIREDLDERNFEAEVREFASEFGIPPFITMQAKSLLCGTGHIVDLANGGEVDAGDVMRSVLRAFGSQIKVLDLANLIGNGLPEPDQVAEQRNAQANDRDAFLKNAKSIFAF